jgi:hypothetical protein
MKELLYHLDRYGHHYNTKELGLFFYALVKMKKWNYFVDLGTAYGCTAFAAATAMKENAKGKVLTIDNGLSIPVKNYGQFLLDWEKRLELKNIDFIIDNINFDKLEAQMKVDCVFSDIYRDVPYLNNVIEWTIRNANDCCDLFIDNLGNPNHIVHSNVTFYYMKDLINKLNTHKIPKFLKKHKEYIETHTFEMTSIRRSMHKTNQAETTWIKMRPTEMYQQVIL